MPKNICHSAMHSRFPFFLTILLHVGAFGSSWSFSCVFHSTFFGCWLHFSHGWEVVFVVLGIGLFSSRFGSCWCIFHSHFCSFMCFFTMAVKGHSRFWLSHRLLVSCTDYLGRFSLLWVVLTDKLQDCVFSPMLWAIFAVTFGDLLYDCLGVVFPCLKLW